MSKLKSKNFSADFYHFWIFFALVFLSLAFKLILLKDFRFLPLVGDEYRYWHNSLRVLRNYFCELNNQAPLYPIFIGFNRLIFNDVAMLVVRIKQLLFHSFEIFLIYLIARKVFDKKTAFIAGSFACFYPELASFAYLLFSETFFLAFFLSAVAVYFYAIDGRRKNSYLWVGASGFLNGIASLTRSVNFYFLPLFALHLFLFFPAEKKKRFLSAGIFILATLFPVSFQTAKNYKVERCFILIDTCIRYNLFVSHNIGISPHTEFRIYRRLCKTERERCEGKNICEEIKCELKNAFNFIFAHPVLTIKRIPIKIIDLYTPNQFIYKNIFYERYYRRVPIEKLVGFDRLKKYQGRWFRIICSGSYLLMMLFAFLGFATSKEKPFRAFVAFLVFYYTSVCAFFFGLSRFRQPMLPLFIILAGAFWADVKIWDRKKLYLALLALASWLVMLIIYLDRLRVILR